MPANSAGISSDYRYLSIENVGDGFPVPFHRDRPTKYMVTNWRIAVSVAKSTLFCRDGEPVPYGIYRKNVPINCNLRVTDENR